jgi:hypothetical protein
MKLLYSTLLVAGLTGATALSQEPAQPPMLPPAAAHPVDFAGDIEPILSRSCARCHARGQSKGRFSIETREALLQGGREGPAAIPGNSADSLLVRLVSGLDPDLVMPEKGPKLTGTQIGLLRAWIDQGLSWDPAITFARPDPRNLDPRTPALPPATAPDAHPVDRLLTPYFAEHGLEAAAPADDRALVRRLYLDLIGVLPTPAAVDAFVANRSPDKVRHLAAVLLADRHQYAVHWLAFWNDLLRNDYRGPGYIDGGRRQISAWLYTALAGNMPYDAFVRELVNPGPQSEGFTRGIIWRGVVNASQTPPMQAAQNVSQVFMGVNLKCASCHDSFIDDWQLADAYGLAAVYATGPLEMVECDRPTGQTAPMKLLYPSLGTIDPNAPRAARLEQVATSMTSADNGRLPRTIVNRLWARLMGRGLVEPLDDMEQPSWHPDLLDWLASDLVAHDYDLTHTLTRLVTSDAYRRAAVEPPAEDEPFRFRGPLARRMTAEQFVDAVSTVTGVWKATPMGEFGGDVANGSAPALDAAWIWTHAAPEPVRTPQTYAFRASVELSRLPLTAPIVIGHPRQYTLFVNGTRVAGGGSGARPQVIDIRSHLAVGRNVVAIAVSEPALPTAPPPRAPADGDEFRPPPEPPAPTARALLVQLHARFDEGAAPLETLLTSGRDWRWSVDRPDGWEQPLFPDRTWSLAVGVPRATAVPSGYERGLDSALAMASLHGRTRTALTAADPLTTALGRPTREQVVTVRADAPTTLQALELVNGETLADLLRVGATRLLAEAGPHGESVVRTVYARALGRAPSEREAALALDLLGPTPSAAGVEDLLWAVVMLPEFQVLR